MRPTFPSGPSTRFALWWLGLLAAMKAASLILLAQSVATLLAALAAGDAGAAGPVGNAIFGAVLSGAAGAILRSVSVWGQSVAARRAALGVKEELRASLLGAALSPRGRHIGYGQAEAAVGSDGGMAILATKGLDALDNYYTQFLPALVNCAVIPLIIGARILLADWVSALVIVFTVPLVPLFMVLIGRHTEERVREAQATLSRLSGHIVELAKGLPVLVGLGRAAGQRKALEELSNEYRHRTMGTLRTAFMSSLALELIATISVAVVAVFIGVRLVAGEMPLEAGLLALLLAPDCYLPLRELGTAHHASDEGRVALAAANAVLAAAPAGAPGTATPSTVESNKQEGPPGVTASQGHNASGHDPSGHYPSGLEVEGLTVRYDGRRQAAVGPLTFSARPGTVTALSGPSGSGKSTVLGVLAGTVRDDGSKTSVEGRYSGFDANRVAWVPQHPTMVAATVGDEVLLYLSGMGSEQDLAAAVLRCLHGAAASHLAARHPAELSPGELRRVALARGLARIEAGATLLLLDEPTAHLDDVAAHAVHQAIRNLPAHMTVLLVAHDAQTRALADYVVDVEPDQGRPGTALRSLPTIGRSTGDHATRSITAASTPDPAPSYVPNETPASGGVPGTLSTLLGLLAPLRWRFAGAALLGVLAACFAAALSGLSGWLIIRASEQPPILYLLGAIVGVRFFGIGRAVLRYCERLALHDAVFATVTKLRGALWASLSRRALSLRRLLQGGTVLGSVVDDVDTVRDLLPRVILPPVAALAVAGGTVAVAVIVLPAAVPAVLAAVVVSLLIGPALALAGDRMAARAEQRLRVRVLRDAAAAIDARDDLMANRVSSPVLSAIGKADRAATDASQRSAWADGLGQAATTLACSLAAVASAVLTVPAIADGSAAGATVAVVVLLLLALVEPSAAATTAVRQFPALREVLGRVAAAGALDHKTLDSSDTGLVSVPDREDGRDGVRIEGLAAAWPHSDPIFEGVAAEAGPGSWMAVRGPSGSGKSTLMAVLLGFLEPVGGRAEVSGSAAWCPQEAHLFDSTIRGNLLLGLPSGGGAADVERQLGDAVAAVGLGSLLGRLDDGLDSRIGPGGAFLSGGERQRLAVARTLLTGADVILLDEPTAHLDAESARMLLADLRVGLADRTVILVTHNPADIDDSDSVLVLGGGDAADDLPGARVSVDRQGRRVNA
ncbi:thiol reductant ABC exporter subunit CydD [Arthrobacter sp. M4]|uniref:thiol reductant ABC exporter subunit CydD n=1 Tax=Arthrobacter sp. M4 TaxID=218160 RepID=UPI001CDCCF03|nr:thiol reductant ABC exporter subunit CydD [Arthrobacter sp. M4]MCA4132728.1 thiol reductant ABC exporter subunit CydD [Arthrobacter sp. M4]